MVKIIQLYSDQPSIENKGTRQVLVYTNQLRIYQISSDDINKGTVWAVTVAKHYPTNIISTRGVISIFTRATKQQCHRRNYTWQYFYQLSQIKRQSSTSTSSQRRHVTFLNNFLCRIFLSLNSGVYRNYFPKNSPVEWS